MKNLKMKSVLL